MKYIFSLSVVLFVVISAAIANQCGMLSYGTCDNQNLGVVTNPGGLINKVYIYNRGPTPLNVKRIVTSCNCLAVEVPGLFQVAPFGKKAIDIAFKQTTLRGGMSAQILLEADSFWTPNIQFEVALNYQPKIQIVQGNGYVGTLSPDEKVSRIEIILDVDPEYESSLRAVSPFDWCKISLKKDTDVPRRWILALLIHKDESEPRLAFQDCISLFVEKQKDSIFNVPFSCAFAK